MGMGREAIGQGVRLAAYGAAALVLALGVSAGLRAAGGSEPVQAQGRAACFRLGEAVRVASVADGRTLTLADGRKVRLSGMAAQAGADALARLTVRLRNLVEGQEVRLGVSAPATVAKPGAAAYAHIVLKDGTWLQARLVEEGLAPVQFWPPDAGCALDLLALESAARARGRGLWAKGAGIVAAAKADAAIGSFAVVEGVIASARTVRGRVYLNFGADYRTDFTIHVPPDAAKTIAASGLDLEALSGRRIRVRGWVTRRNGPSVTVVHRAQFEGLDVPLPRI
jgi:endonuclease YncB( thermonuclease family)